MLNYREYINESKYKLVREKTGIYKILDLKLNETDMHLDQNLNYGKKWDLIIEGNTKGEFKTKHDALIYLESL